MNGLRELLHLQDILRLVAVAEWHSDNLDLELLKCDVDE